jgi:hypothetical protein
VSDLADPRPNLTHVQEQADRQASVGPHDELGAVFAYGKLFHVGAPQVARLASAPARLRRMYLGHGRPHVVESGTKLIPPRLQDVDGVGVDNQVVGEAVDGEPRRSVGGAVDEPIGGQIVATGELVTARKRVNDMMRPGD